MEEMNRVRSEEGASMELLGTPLSQHLHVFTKPEALQTQSS